MYICDRTNTTRAMLYLTGLLTVAFSERRYEDITNIINDVMIFKTSGLRYQIREIMWYLLMYLVT